MQRSLLPILLLVWITASCATRVETSPTQEFAISGSVTAGPTCPVVQDPPDPACADKPVPGAFLLITTADGDTASEVRTDAEGRFTVNLPAGRYLLEPQPVEGLLGTAERQAFEVGPGIDPPELIVSYDTGIR